MFINAVLFDKLMSEAVIESPEVESGNSIEVICEEETERKNGDVVPKVEPAIKESIEAKCPGFETNKHSYAPPEGWKEPAFDYCPACLRSYLQADQRYRSIKELNRRGI